MRSTGNWKKRIILVVLFLLTGCVSLSSYRHTTFTKAYTEKQKQEAKAWLSAHGYPATKEGAYQAYRDYLSGKLTLGEDDQKRLDQSLGKSSKKDKERTQKKKKGKSSKKKRSSDKEKEAVATPKTKPSDDVNTTVKKQQTALPASPSASVKETGNRPETNEEKNKGIDKGYLFGGVCLIVVLAGSISLYIWKRKSTR